MYGNAQQAASLGDAVRNLNIRTAAAPMRDSRCP